MPQTSLFGIIIHKPEWCSFYVTMLPYILANFSNLLSELSAFHGSVVFVVCLLNHEIWQDA